MYANPPTPKHRAPNPKTHSPTPTSSPSHTCTGVQTADSVQIDLIRPYLLGQLPPGSKGPVNRLANRTYTRACTRMRAHLHAHAAFSLLGRNQHRVRLLSLHPAHVHCRCHHFLLCSCCISVRCCARAPQRLVQWKIVTF